MLGSFPNMIPMPKAKRCTSVILQDTLGGEALRVDYY